MTGYNTWGVSWGTSWGVSWGSGSSPTPTASRDQGAGAGHKKESAGEQRRKYWQNINEQTAISLERPKAQELPEQKKKKKPAEIIKFIPRQPKIGDDQEIRQELSKLKFAVTEEILLQSMEDDALALLLLMS